MPTQAVKRHICLIEPSLLITTALQYSSVVELQQVCGTGRNINELFTSAITHYLFEYYCRHILSKTLLKGLAMLDYLANCPSGQGVSAIAAAMDLPKSNTHRTLATLAEAGYVMQTETGQYQTTLRVWELGVQVISRHPVRRAALPFMHALKNETTESINLVVTDGDDSVYIHQLSSATPIRSSSTVGERAPSILTVSGRTMLAMSPDSEERARALFRKQKSPKPPFSLSQLLAELSDIRKQGYFSSSSVWRPGINCLAGVIYGPSKMPMGSIVVAGPKERFSEERMQAMIDSVLNACTNASAALGG